MHNLALKQPPHRTPITNRQHRAVEQTLSSASAPLALLYPPVLEAGVVEAIKDNVLGEFKKNAFQTHSASYSGLIVFARYAGLLNDIEWLNDGAKSVSYDKLYDLYCMSAKRITNWLNKEQFNISGVRSNQSFLSLDTTISKKKDPVLWLTGHLTASYICMSGDVDIDALVHSVLVLLSGSGCALLPEDYLYFNEWFYNEGEALVKLKKQFNSDDLAYIAKEVCKNPERYDDILCEVELAVMEGEETLLENLEYLDENFEEIPDHLTHKKALSAGQIQYRLNQWTAKKDERINDPRIAAVRQGLKVHRMIAKRAKLSIERPDQTIRVDGFDVSDGDFDNYLHADASVLVQYGLKFEDKLCEIFYNESMEMGEEPTSFFSLNPCDNKQLHDTLLNMAQAQGVITLLETVCNP